MSPRAVAAVAAALVCVFAAVTVSVVRARDGIDDRVAASFGRTVTGSLGCEKLSVDTYSCAAVVPAGHRLYRVTLRDDGCWNGLPAPAFPPVQGCLAR
jgi:hypothetical protein